jgi:hypothetical protein
MSWLVSAKQYIPAVIGEPFGGGYFAGYISHTADGNPTHALIVAPRATGAGGSGYSNPAALWKTTATSTAGANSTFDGAANTAVMVAAGIAEHPIAQLIVGLTIGGFTDWYFPARDELDIAYFNLKPTTTANNVNQGVNIYAVPRRASNWTAGYPIQTALTAFNTSAESFTAQFHSSSNETSAANFGAISFSTGDRANSSKIQGGTYRAFRRIAL